MAVTKKKTATPTRRRKPGAKAGAKRKKARVSGSDDKIKIAGVSFAKTSCHSTKTAAQKQAERIRAQGNNARVIKSGSAVCVYKGGKTKATAPRALQKARRRAAAR